MTEQKKDNTKQKTVSIIGGGAAGFFTAINVAQKHPELKVTIYEASQKLLSKVKISGGGRCNVTHNCFDINKLASCYPRGSKEMKQMLKLFQPADTLEWFKDRGVEIVPEPDGRMFPTTNKSQTIMDCFFSECKKHNVEIIKGQRLVAVDKAEQTFRLEFKDGTVLNSDYLVMTTGSGPEAIEIINKLGHSIVPAIPSLFTFKIEHPVIEDLPGVAFEKIKVRLSGSQGRKYKYDQIGPMLITHWGLSGPAILKLSAYGARDLFEDEYNGKLMVDFFPEQSKEQLAAMFDKLRQSKKRLSTENPFHLTKRFWKSLSDHVSKSEDAKWCDLSKKDWNKLIESVKSFELQVQGKGVFKEEFVTSGGIKLSEVSLKSMQSQRVNGLFFAGEILNIDGITGGFNFQNAWTGSWIISENILK